MSLPLSDIVNPTILVSPTAPTARGFGVGEFVGLSTVLPLEERVRSYSSLAGIAVDFGTNTDEYKGGQAWFGDGITNPSPTKMKIGRRFPSGAAGHLRGGGASTLLATYTGITNGGFDIVINGVNRQVTGLNFSGAASINAVAALIQTALQALLASTTCVLTGTAFLITSPTVGTSSNVGYPTAPTGGGSPVDIRTTLALTQAAGALSVTGIAAESMTDSLVALKVADPDFYHLTLSSDASVQDHKDAMAWAETNNVLFWYTTADVNAPVSAATSDLGYYAKNLSYARTISFSDLSNPLVNTTLYLSWAAAAIMATIDFTQPNSIKTLKFKQVTGGFAAAPVTTTQNDNLKGKNYNRYVDRGGFKMIEDGQVANGRFIDEVIGLDWLQANLQIAIFGPLSSLPRVPQTDAGAAILVQAGTGIFEQAVRNGLLAPGKWTGQNVGEVKSGDFLPLGYYLFAGPVAEMSQSDREARLSPPITGICIGAGAIHKVSPVITFQR